jgi:hypothetical protein
MKRPHKAVTVAVAGNQVVVMPFPSARRATQIHSPRFRFRVARFVPGRGAALNRVELTARRRFVPRFKSDSDDHAMHKA